MQKIINRSFGWRRDLPDARDALYAMDPRFLRASPALPPKIDLSTSPHMPPIADQGELGSCTSFATCAAYDFLAAANGRPFLAPSHLFQYYNARLIEHTTSEDAGASIRDAIKVTGKYGMCPETLWPYAIGKFATKPPQSCYAKARGYEVVQYLSVDNRVIGELQQCLADGHPIVFGATLYESFEHLKHGAIVPMPRLTEQVLGGHAQLIVGYDNANKLFKVRNSWGTSWGDAGYEYMPYTYITNPQLASDFWTLRTLEAQAAKAVA